MTKTCSKCKQNKPFSSFDTSELQLDGYCNWCQSCQKAFKEMISRPTLKQIEIAAREAKYAAAGIIIDGVKLSIPIKVCRDCAVQYPATSDYFYKNKQIKDGWSGKCRKCTKNAKRLLQQQPGYEVYKLTDAEKEERARKQRVKRQVIRKEAQKWAKRKAKNKKGYDEVGMLLTELTERENNKGCDEVGMLLTEM